MICTTMPWMLSPSTEIDNSTLTAKQAQVIGMDNTSENGSSSLSMNHDCSAQMAGAIPLHLAPPTKYPSPLNHGFLMPSRDYATAAFGILRFRSSSFSLLLFVSATAPTPPDPHYSTIGCDKLRPSYPMSMLIVPEPTWHYCICHYHHCYNQ